MKTQHSYIASLRMWFGLILRPPTKQHTREGYDALRKKYVLNMCCQHFGKNADEPAPLYGLKLLDVGCGHTPELATFLALAGADVVAIDPDKIALQQAENIAKNYGVPVTFYPKKLEDMVSEAETYDIILTLDVLSYVNDVQRIIWAQEKLLNKQGVIVFSGIRKTIKSWILHIGISSYILNRIPVGMRKWSGFYRIQTLRVLFAKHGLNVKAVQGLKFNIQHKKWQLAKKPDTRYLGTATRI